MDGVVLVQGGERASLAISGESDAQRGRDSECHTLYVRGRPQTCFTYRPGGTLRPGMLVPRAGSVWKSDEPLDELMWTSLSDPEVECVVLIQSISEPSSHYDVKLCVQNSADQKRKKK